MTEEEAAVRRLQEGKQTLDLSMKVGRVIGASLVVYAFLLLLMTQIAQASVMSRLEKTDASLSYSGAHAVMNSDAARLNDLNRLRREIAVADHWLAGKNGELNQAEFALAYSRGRFLSIALPVRELCGLDLNAQEPSSVVNAWAPTQSCSTSNPAFPSHLRRDLAAMHEGPARNLPSQAAEVSDLRNQIAQRETEISTSREAFAELTAELLAHRPIHAAFDEMNVIRQGWMLGGRYLIDIPPALLQLPLAFASGCFGALLISLILVVYPSARVTTAVQDDATRRTLLGGLIAICVYIVLLSGTAVLGTSHGFGDTNHMTFSAIGILAGMFSDRVAAWLSDRANSFFGRANR